jgi:carboxyl-terminal processing protease
MPRRNFYLLIGLSLVSLLCYQEGGGQRSRYGRMFRTFSHVMQEIEENYVEPVDERKLFEGALSGMTRQLDEYSSYINPTDFRELQEDLGKSFGGIGIQVTLDEETRQLTVMSPVVGTPAYEAGIVAGDKIVKINDESTEGFSLQDAVARIRGEPGESVRLTLFREGAAEPKEYELKRAAIHVDTVLGDTRDAEDAWNFFLDDDARIGYVRVTAFSEQTADELDAAMTWLVNHRMRSLILDLRNNPGGLLRSAVAISDLFIDHGNIVTTKGRRGEVLDDYEATPGKYLHFPMVVLVNQYSASASEIVSACLQDHDRAVVIGQRTWGKGSVQNIIGLEEGRSALRLTMASYWRPSGRNIHRRRDAKEEDEWGVKPNPGFEVKLEPDEFQKLLTERRERDIVRPHMDEAGTEALPDVPQEDPQLRRALQYLRQQLEKPAEAA